MENYLWLIISILLVFTMPFGLALFYGGAVRFKNSISAMSQVALIFPIITILWFLIGHHLIFGQSVKGFFGMFESLDHHLLFLSITDTTFNVPTLMFSLFQLLFAIIAVVIIMGAYLERTSLKFSLLFLSFWFLLVYCPVAHWVWSDHGWLKELGAVDFAGGIVVHITTGITALLLAILIGRRQDYFKLRKHYNNGFIFLGTFLIWFGWFGFNGGSTLLFDQSSMNALLSTLLAGCSGILAWVAIECLHTPHKISLTGICVGLISGLVAITPGADFMSPLQSLLCGAISGVVCNYSVRLIHPVWKVDDVLDVFSSHCVGGIIGSLLTGIFHSGENTLLANIQGILSVLVYTLLVSFLIYKVLNYLVKARVQPLVEEKGLDIQEHGEEVINL